MDGWNNFIHLVMLLRHLEGAYYGILLFIYLKSSTSAHAEDPEKTYVFAFSNDGFPANFITKNGQLDGQSVRLVKKVCERAGKSCDTAVVPRADCWDTSTNPALSNALDEDWFDACANLPQSSQRYLGYLSPPVSYFNTPYPSIVVRRDSPITVNDLRSCNNLRLAYLDNLGLTPECLLTSSYWVDKSLFVRIPGVSSLITGTARVVRAVLKGQADIGLVVTRFLNPRDVKVLCTVPCSGDLTMSLNILMRKNNCALYNWWSAALVEFVCQDYQEYQRFCKDLAKDFRGNDPHCLTPGRDIDCNSTYGVIRNYGNQAKDIVRITPCEVYSGYPRQYKARDRKEDEHKDIIKEPTKVKEMATHTKTKSTSTESSTESSKSTKSSSKSSKNNKNSSKSGKSQKSSSESGKSRKKEKKGTASSSSESGKNTKKLSMMFGHVNNLGKQEMPSSFGFSDSPLAAHFRSVLNAKKKKLGKKASLNSNSKFKDDKH